jgi:hypothetical protein
MADTTPPQSNVPQFGKAEYISNQGGSNCAMCKRSLGASYYRVQSHATCEACAMKVKASIPLDSHAAFTSALLFGIGGAILGFIAYSAFTIITKIEIGFVSIAVGYLVGKAMKMGAKGAGGRRYQIAAVLLTYAAVSMSAIPIALSQDARNAAAQRQTSQSAQQSTPSDSSGAASTDPSSGSNSTAATAKPSLLLSLATLAGIGLASPFLALQDPVYGAIGLVILFVGMRYAWQLTAGLPEGIVAGPFANKAGPSAEVPPQPLG